jgi:hypothetical protein
MHVASWVWPIPSIRGTDIVAKQIIEAAQAGKRNPIRLRDCGLKAITNEAASVGGLTASHADSLTSAIIAYERAQLCAYR